ncbi:MAG: hypothetical protein ACO3AR_07315, partial [Bacteroidia bacterium]
MRYKLLSIHRVFTLMVALGTWAFSQAPGADISARSKDGTSGGENDAVVVKGQAGGVGAAGVDHVKACDGEAG